MGKVLIFDDEKAIGDYLARLIGGLGHQAVTTLTVAETFGKLAEGDFQLVIADILVPDAPDPKKWIKQLCEKAKGIPVVLISGAPSQELTECATENGVLAFLSKPFELAFIKNILKNVLEN